VLNRMVDGSLLVTRIGMVEAEQLKSMYQFLVQSGHRVLGTVVNGLESRGDRSGHFYDVVQVKARKVEQVV
jgi:polysaccharide biosynthesis transport protein